LCKLIEYALFYRMRLEVDVRAQQPALSVTAVWAIATVALAVALGIGRFAFTPLQPLMMRDGLLPQSAGPWLAASNYAGYLVGASTTSRLGLSLPTLMRVSLAGTAASTAAMGVFDGLAVWIVLRGIAGVLSAWTLVATSAWALQNLVRAARADLSGRVYAGVGIGIAFAGLFCIVRARPGVPASQLWLELGALTALAIIAPSYFVARPPPILTTRTSIPLANRTVGTHKGLVICYGAFGFGYILPATFLPALAREMVDNPQLFGLAWPIFGFAAAMSTVATARLFGRVNQLRVWSVSHLVMATGIMIPSLWLTLGTIAIAALCVGSTFMVVTVIGMQEARARAPANPTALLGLMTAAFAIGQLFGPLFSGTIALLPVGDRAALGWAMQIAAATLLVSAAYLWSQSCRGPSD
jgi:MFS family permease